MGQDKMGQDKSVAERLWAFAMWALVIFFVVNVMATIAAVAVNSFGTRWFGGWLPAGFTAKWYADAWSEFQLDDVLIVTFEVVGAVVVLSGLIGVPAAYEQYDYSMASAVAMIMGFVQLAVVVAILAARALVYRGATAGGKG